MIFGIFIVGGGFNDGLGPDCRVARFEDAGTDKDALRAQLHHQGGIGRSGHTAGGKVDHRQFPGFMHFQ